MTDFCHQSNFKPLKLVTYLISADREVSIEIRLVANLKIRNLEIVNINTKHIYFIKILMTSHRGISYLIEIQNEIGILSVYVYLNFIMYLAFVFNFHKVM